MPKFLEDIQYYDTSGTLHNLSSEFQTLKSTAYTTSRPPTKSTVGLSNVANERQYSSSNPPPSPSYNSRYLITCTCSVNARLNDTNPKNITGNVAVQFLASGVSGYLSRGAQLFQAILNCASLSELFIASGCCIFDDTKVFYPTVISWQNSSSAQNKLYGYQSGLGRENYALLTQDTTTNSYKIKDYSYVELKCLS